MVSPATSLASADSDVKASSLVSAQNLPTVSGLLGVSLLFLATLQTSVGDEGWISQLKHSHYHQHSGCQGELVGIPHHGMIQIQGLITGS